MYVLKGLFYEYKIKAYQKVIRAIQVARDKMKAKQAKATVGLEKYISLSKEHKFKG
jgi:hypothetical protein